MIEHPLTKLFDMETYDAEADDQKAYEMQEVPKEQLPVAQEGAQIDSKDADDILIEGRIDEVYKEAMNAFKSQNDMIEVIDPRYMARMAEVAATYLNLALSAANSRARNKTDRIRSKQFVPYANNGGGKTTTNVVVATREEVLRMITIDQEPKEIK